MQRVVNQFDGVASQLERLLGQGYGSNIDRLVEALENFKLQGQDIKVKESPSDIGNELHNLATWLQNQSYIDNDEVAEKMEALAHRLWKIRNE